VYAPPVLKGETRTPVAEVFFSYVKAVLTDAGYQRQQEILVERAEVYLLPEQALPKAQG
jgi:hypothetical protein